MAEESLSERLDKIQLSNEAQKEHYENMLEKMQQEISLLTRTVTHQQVKAVQVGELEQQKEREQKKRQNEKKRLEQQVSLLEQKLIAVRQQSEQHGDSKKIKEKLLETQR